MKWTSAIPLSIVAIVVGCASFPKDDITIETESDPRVNFSGYQTYAWLGDLVVVNDPAGYWEPLDFDAEAEVAYLIDTALRKRGMRRVTEQPDMLVAYAVGVDMDAIEARIDPETDLPSLMNVPQAGLVVMLLDPATERITWAGVAEGDLQNQGSETAKKRLNYAVNKMFDELPK